MSKIDREYLKRILSNGLLEDSVLSKIIITHLSDHYDIANMFAMIVEARDNKKEERIAELNKSLYFSVTQFGSVVDSLVTEKTSRNAKKMATDILSSVPIMGHIFKGLMPNKRSKEIASNIEKRLYERLKESLKNSNRDKEWEKSKNIDLYDFFEECLNEDKEE